MSKIIIINGNPKPNSLCDGLVEGYVRGLGIKLGNTGEAQDLVREITVRDLVFNPNLTGGLKGDQELEPDLVQAQELINKAQHLVWVYPNWWGTMPALLKGFIDRVFLPGFAFRYKKQSALVDQLLKGKTSRLIISMDGPSVWYRLAMGGGGDKAMINSTLQFSGIKVRGVYHADMLRGSKLPQAPRHLKRVEELGRQDRRTYGVGKTIPR